MERIIIKPIGGLCNRLSFMFSFIRKLIDQKKLKNTQLIIIWNENESCPGKIESYFRKIRNVKFNYHQNYKPDMISYKIIEDYTDILYLKKIPLFLNDNIYKKIKKIINRKLKNNYISIHIRRTDLQKNLEKHKARKKNIISDKEYIHFINQSNKKYIYLATDNKETQIKFQKIYKNRLIIYDNIINKDSLRQTNLEHAIIDIFICGCSIKFKGSYYSSFSSFIQLISKVCRKYKDPNEKLRHFINNN